MSFTLWASDQSSLFAGCWSPRQGRLSLTRLLCPWGGDKASTGLCWSRVSIPFLGVAVPDPAGSPLLTALPGEKMGKGFVQPLLGFLHSCGTKGIFLVLMTLFTIHVFPSMCCFPPW